MTNQNIHNLIIIGSGPAGLTAGIYAARANLKPVLIEGENPGGQLMGTSIVENWPGIRSILGPDLMRQMRNHAQSCGVKFIEGTVTSVNFLDKPFTIMHSSDTMRAHAVIISTGASPNKLGCPGEKEYWGKGVTTCAVCDATLYAGRKALIVGGGNSAMESASFLRKFTDHVTIVHILDKMTASYAMQQRILHDPKITVIYQSTVTEIIGDGNKVTGAIVTHQKTDQKIKIDVDGIFLAIGLTPNTQIFNNQLELDKKGYIVLKEQSLTSIPGIFAAGDVADSRYRQAITSAGTGCMAALDAEQYLKDIFKY